MSDKPVSRIELPEHLPLNMQDIDIMRCVTCGAILPGMWGVTRELNAPGVDHILDRHREMVVQYTLPRPPIVNCAIQDPFWFEEHADCAPGECGGGC